MTTSQFIEEISKKCLQFKTQAEILTLTNIAQNELLGVNCDLMRTKPDPFLTTTDGVYSYTLSVGVRAVSMVYVREPMNIGYGRTYLNNLIEYEGYDRAGNQILEVPVYIEQSLSPTQPVTIQFDSTMNPSTSTDVYRLEQYNWPEQLTSTAIPLSIPTQYVSRVLLARVMQMIEQDGFGRGGSWDSKYEMYRDEFETYRDRNRTIDNTTIRPL